MKRKNLTQGPVAAHIIKLALPMMVGVFSIMVFNLIDTYFIGRLGTDALAAISFTFPVVMLVGSISFGMTMAMTSMISRLMGEQRSQKIKQTVSDCLCFALVIVLFISLFGQLSLDWVFQSLGAKDHLMPLIKDYMQIWYYSIIFLLIPMMGNGAIRGLGDTLFPAIVMLVAAGVNAIFDPILIFGYFGFPAFGIKGAAYATVISRVFTLIAGLLVLHYREKLLVRPFKNIQESLQHIRDLIRLGIPAALNNMIGPISIAIITKMIAQYGPEAIAGFGVASKVESFVTIPLMGIAAGLGPYAGQNFGAHLNDRLKQGIAFANKSSTVILLIMGLICVIFAQNVSQLFSNNPEVIRSATIYMQSVALSYVFLSFLANTNSSLISMGKPKLALWITILRTLILYIPLAFVLSYFFKLSGIYYAAGLANIFAGLAALYYIRKTLMACFKPSILNNP
ncbi:MAG TPA: MATE family efflux transporter [Oligoflexia bacterium]|nr:MATE family efflux transporter [Oligoflexia bacterium]HMR25230.1 MATE family efflux transporter [Oligoflexia bacterium]